MIWTLHVFSFRYQFPAVTICNKNSFTKSTIDAVQLKMNVTGIDELLKESFDSYVYSQR